MDLKFNRECIPSFTFSSFIPLKSNKKALMRCKKICEDALQASQGRKQIDHIKPLFLASYCGAGNSHLLHSICAELKSLDVVLIHAESIQRGEQRELNVFFEELKIKNSDVLIIEDFHFLHKSTNPNTIKSIVDLLNDHYQNGKAVIVSMSLLGSFRYDKKVFDPIFKQLPFLLENEVGISNMDFEDRVKFLENKISYLIEAGNHLE